MYLNDLDQFGSIFWCPGNGFDASLEHQDRAVIRLNNRLAIREVGSTGKIYAPVCSTVWIMGEHVSQATPARYH